MKTLALLLTSLLFVSCSNMTIGLEEDSPFYNGPIVDTREDVQSEEIEQETEKSIQKHVIERSKETTPQENETTFSYEREDD